MCPLPGTGTLILLLLSGLQLPLQATDLKVSQNGRFLLRKSDETPFFYLADTAWELFHKLNRAEATSFLDNRQKKGFTVIQAVALAELDGLNTPNAHGDRPLKGNNPATPATTTGSNPSNTEEYDYWDHVDYIIKEADARSLYIGLLPSWGKYMDNNGNRIFDVAKAESYGRFLGSRYATQKNIIWILGGDRMADGVENIWRAMAKGIAIGISGTEDYTKPLMTYHPRGGGHSSTWFHNDTWLDLNMFQSGHGIRDNPNYNMTAKDYSRTPQKPTLDGEPAYEDHPVKNESGYFRDHDVRKRAYWSVFAGAAGHTYGHHSIWQFHRPGSSGRSSPDRYWTDGIDRPGASHMKHLRALIESRPFLTRIPDQSLLASEAGTGANHKQATRSSDGSFGFIYIPNTQTFSVNMTKINGQAKAWWFNPRTGEATPFGTFPNTGTRSFTTPPNGPDWVLVLDGSDAFPPPGSTSRPQLTFSLELSAAWNLISLPLQPADDQIETLFADIKNSVQAIYSYTGTDYITYSPKDISTLTRIVPGAGYWIYMSAPGRVQISGNQPDKTIRLVSGWNLVGYNSTQAAQVGVAIGSLKGITVYAFDTLSNSYKAYGQGTHNSLERFEPGQGYWIYSEDDLTWTLP
jgi:hypothetical protein